MNSRVAVFQTKQLVEGYNLFVYAQGMLPKRIREIMCEIEGKLPTQLEEGAPKGISAILPMLKRIYDSNTPKGMN